MYSNYNIKSCYSNTKYMVEAQCLKRVKLISLSYEIKYKIFIKMKILPRSPSRNDIESQCQYHKRIIYQYHISFNLFTYISYK